MIITPRVKNYIQSYFNCSDVSLGAYLEDKYRDGYQSGHWEYDVFRDELMVGGVFTSGNRVTKLTLSLLDDTGYYDSVNYEMAEATAWGKD